jgi:hypothetical protein
VGDVPGYTPDGASVGTSGGVSPEGKAVVERIKLQGGSTATQYNFQLRPQGKQAQQDEPDADRSESGGDAALWTEVNASLDELLASRASEQSTSPAEPSLPLEALWAAGWTGLLAPFWTRSRQDDPRKVRSQVGGWLGG